MLICHLSDLHVRAPGQLAYRCVDSAAYLQRCVAHIKGLTPLPDAVVVTGDLTDRGEPEEYEHLLSLLEPLSAPVYVIPGNHDKRALMRSAFASRQYLAQSDDFIQYTAEIGPLRLIALDPVVAGEGGGELCRDRLAWLDRQLLHYRSFPVLIVIASPSVSDGNPLHGRRGTTRRPAVRNLGQPLSERGARTLRPCPSHDLAPLRRDHRIELSESGSPVTLDFSPDAEPGFTMEPPGYLLHRWTDSEGITSYSAVIGDYEGPYPFYPNHLGAG